MNDKLELTLLYEGKIIKGSLITHREEYVEASLEEQVTLIVGDYIQMFFKGKPFDMRILQSRRNWVALFPSTSEIFQISTRMIHEDDRRKNTRFPFDSICIINDGYKNIFANTVDISRGGMGIVLSNSVMSQSKFRMQQNTVYTCSIGCTDEWIQFRFLVKNVFEVAEGLRYGVEMQQIGERELNLLRYFIVANQLQA